MAKWYLKWILSVYLLMNLIIFWWIFIACCSQYNSIVFFFNLIGIPSVAQHSLKTLKYAVLTSSELLWPLGHMLQVIWMKTSHDILDISFVNNIKQTISKYINNFTLQRSFSLILFTEMSVLTSKWP